MKPTTDRLLLKQWEWPEKTSGGIIIQSAGKDKPNIAKVVAVGPDVKVIEPGNIVFLGTKWFTNLSIGKREFLVVNEPDIAGVADHDDLEHLAEYYSDPNLKPE